MVCCAGVLASSLVSSEGLAGGGVGVNSFNSSGSSGSPARGLCNLLDITLSSMRGSHWAVGICCLVWSTARSAYE